MASQNPWPFMPVKSTEMLLMHADPTVYTGTPDTILYKLVDAICGTTGAGALVNEIFLARAAGALETIYFNDLDYIFGKVNFLARSPAESYTFDPNVDELTADQWNEVRVKDAWYRSRVKDFFLACGLGTTLDGIRMAVQAALAVDADVFEVWRYVDNFGITEDLGRSPGGNARNELVVRPHKTSLAPVEMRLLRDMLDRMTALDTIITVNPQGLSVLTPVPVTAAAADSTYYEVQKVVTPSPLMAQLPEASQLPINLGVTQQWMYSTTPVQAPYAAFNMSQEYSYFYLTGGGKRSPIDSVTYGTINSPTPPTIAVYELIGRVDSFGTTTTVPTTGWFASGLNNSLFQYFPVTYTFDEYPMSAGLANGKATLINAINARTGPFIIVGYDQGAIIASNVYDEIRSGSLSGRRADLLGGVVFGNARREAGHTFPGGSDPGGHGIWKANLLEQSEDLWWEFAIPGDLATTVDDDAKGTAESTLFDLVLPNYEGNISTVTELLIEEITNPLAVTQAIVDLFYAIGNASDPHRQYTTYRPLADSGDVSTCVDLARQYITRLASTPKLTVEVPNYPVIAYEVGDTGSTPYVTSSGSSPTTSAFPNALSDQIKYVSVPYPADVFPMNTSIATGVANLTAMINRNPGKFVLIGIGQGAVVTSLVYEDLKSGSLIHRWSDLVGGVTFGSPMREAGHTFPDCPDPGGHGIASARLISTDSFWWDFANPGDPITTTGDDTTGHWMTTLFDAYNWYFTGNLSTVVNPFSGAPLNVSALLSAIVAISNGESVGSPHNTYYLTKPLADSGDDRTSFKIAVDYLNTFAGLSTPYVAPPFDPMSTYRSEANFESFVETAQFGPWQTYAIADSPDNYPGGKFGVTPSAAPALNPDGTPYNFPYASQTAYVISQITLVQNMGGQADNFHFRMPVTAASTTKEVFLPEYAIAYSAPMMDSTVSTAVTARRNKTVNQSGSNQFFARNGTAPVGG